MKIIRSLVLEDNQKIYCMGQLSPRQFVDEWVEHRYIYLHEKEKSLDYRTHYTIASYIRKQPELSELSEWLTWSNTKITFWVDDKVFMHHPSNGYSRVDWGLGFMLNDPLETAFILRWS